MSLIFCLVFFFGETETGMKRTKYDEKKKKSVGNEERKKKNKHFNIKDRITKKNVLCEIVCSYQKLKPICSKKSITMSENFYFFGCV